MKDVDVMKRKQGVNFNEKNEAEIIVWSPEAEQVEISFANKKLPLDKEGLGYWKLVTNEVKTNEHYKFVLNNAKEFPDPASLSQPEGVHGSSCAINIKNFKWSDNAWNNLPLEEYILYELHTGTFTKEGSFKAIEEKLDHLKELGV